MPVFPNTENRHDHINTLNLLPPFTNMLTFECLFRSLLLFSIQSELFCLCAETFLFFHSSGHYFKSLSFFILLWLHIFQPINMGMSLSSFNNHLPWPAQSLSTHLFLQQTFIEHLLCAKDWTCINFSLNHAFKEWFISTLPISPHPGICTT